MIARSARLLLIKTSYKSASLVKTGHRNLVDLVDLWS